MDFSITIIIFGFGIGVLVGMTGMGGGALMTPLLILLFGVSPTTAIGTDILYAAITKTVGGWRHLKIGTVNLGLVFWLAAGSVPAAVFGVQLIAFVQGRIGEERLDSLVYAVLGGTLLMVGIITLARALILARTIQERDDFKLERRHKVAAVIIGATTGFVIGVTSAGSGTVIAVLLIAVFRLTPKHVVGTDVFHAAIVLWAAGIAHFGHGNVDLGLVGNILLGSVPGVMIGTALMGVVRQDAIRIALGVVLILSGFFTVQKGDPLVWPIAALVAGIGFVLILMAPRWYQHYRPARSIAQERRALAAGAGGSGSGPEPGHGPDSDRPPGRIAAPGRDSSTTPGPDTVN
ncbi:MAG: sulfite exporter TauE/SafE family protein [Solirubrobacterales bacterium]|nr:sulfite exporter TauE/SafE family protein [Solirubrobacterales bacterium]